MNTIVSLGFLAAASFAALGAQARPPGGPEPRHPDGDFNKIVPGTEADDKYYAKVNPDSDFTPRRGGVNAPGGPAPMRLMIAASQDGLRFERKNLIVTDGGAVPDLVVDGDGAIHLYYQACTVGEEINKVAHARSTDGGASWTFKRVELSGFDPPMPEPCDPEIQLLPDGTFRLYLTWAESDGHPCTYLAESSDGTRFQFVGKAFAPDGPALDPSILRIGDTWHLFSGGGRGPEENWHATSSDGKTFSDARGMRLEKDGLFFMMANGLAIPGGGRFYAFNNPRPGTPHRICSFQTKDGERWKADRGTRLEDGGLKKLEEPGFGPLDPAVGILTDGTLLMVYTVRIAGLGRPQQPQGRRPQPGPPEAR